MHLRPPATTSFDPADTRSAAFALLGAATLLPLLPGHAGLPCPLRALTGVPCPLCGMTTSVAATVHGRLGAALLANPAGPLAVAGALALLVRRPRGPIRLPTVAVLGTVLALWLFELHRFSLI